MARLKDYESIVGEREIDYIRDLGSELSEKSMAHVSATFYGGGVAEMLTSYIPLLNDAGLTTEWRLLRGTREFFNVTKKMHNALQGAKVNFTREDVSTYESNLEVNAAISNLKWYDCVIVDDPQPCGLVTLYPRKSPSLWKPLPEFLKLPVFQKKQPWIWRAHIDLSTPNKVVWNYLARYLRHYDAIVVSSKKYARVKKPTFIIPPAIDPLSDKNIELNERKVERILSRYGVDTSIPIVTQVSRFDPWKDPLGVIKAFNKAKKEFKCQLVLIGSMAADDPEGEKIFNDVFKFAENHSDVKLITLQNDLLVNALQRKSAVVFQKSLKEGFGLTVSEALWKGTPVIGGNVGGIPLQIEDGKSGFLVSSVDEAAKRLVYLLKNPRKAAVMGLAGREKVKKDFLMTRVVKDELELCFKVTSKSPVDALIKTPKNLLNKLNGARKLFSP